MPAARSLFVSINNVRGVLHARVRGPNLSQREAPIVLNEVAGSIPQGRDSLRVLLLDLTEIEVMSSQGLACLELRRRAREAGARAVICGLCPRLLELFVMLKLDRLYTITRNEPDLRRALAA
jgi:hypothetical protein